MKKLITTLLFVALLLPGVSRAQVGEIFATSTEAQVTWSSDQEVVIKALQSQLIQLIEQLLTLLMQQQQSMMAQMETTGAVETLNKQLEEVSVGGYNGNTMISTSDIVCKERVNGRYYVLPLTIEGEWRGGFIQINNKTHLLNVSEITDLGGVIIGSSVQNSSLYLNKNGNYRISLYRTANAPFQAIDLVDEKSGEFVLPECK